MSAFREWLVLQIEEEADRGWEKLGTLLGHCHRLSMIGFHRYIKIYTNPGRGP